MSSNHLKSGDNGVVANKNIPIQDKEISRSFQFEGRNDQIGKVDRLKTDLTVRRRKPKTKLPENDLAKIQKNFSSDDESDASSNLARSCSEEILNSTSVSKLADSNILVYKGDGSSDYQGSSVCLISLL